MARLTPEQLYNELRIYTAEFKHREISVMQVQTDDDIANNQRGIDLFPRRKNGISVSLVKFGQQIERSITGKLKMSYLKIFRRITLTFSYFLAHEKDQIETDLFRSENELWLTMHDRKQTLLKSDDLYLDKIKVKMVSQFNSQAILVQTSQYSGNVEFYGQETYKGIDIYQLPPIIFEEIL